MTISDRFDYDDITGFRFGYSPLGRPRMVSHVYYVDGLLIDTGHAKVGQKVFMAVKDLKVCRQFITHYHEDHTGNLARLQEHFQCPAYAAPLTCRIMKDPPPLSLAQVYTWGKRPAYDTLLPKSGQIQTEKYSFDIIPIPGHAPDMVALHEPDKGWLFSSDLFIHTYISFFIHDESMLDQINSMKRVMELEFEVMLCGHNPQLKEPKKALQKKLRFFEQFYDHVADLYGKGLSDKEIFKKMQLKEASFVKLASGGSLSKLNMVRSAIRDIEMSKRGNDCAVTFPLV
jgi:glyoxylase-like metal-dependent hydrolase (beta-lactamase superfamily II)